MITDSQAFEEVAAIVPADIPLTSFSILMARYKGFLKIAVEGVRAIDGLKDGDRVLIAEGCTHHRQCDDIGTVKIPRFLKKYTGKNVIIENGFGYGLSRRPDGLCACDSLRRLYAERAGGIAADAFCAKAGRACDELRHCHCADEGDSRKEY